MEATHLMQRAGVLFSGAYPRRFGAGLLGILCCNKLAAVYSDLIAEITVMSLLLLLLPPSTLSTIEWPSGARLPCQHYLHNLSMSL